MTQIAKDVNNNSIQALRLRTAAAHKITTSAANARNAIAFNNATRVVFIYADQDCYIAFGDATVTATSSDHFLPAGVYLGFATKGAHIAALQASTAGTLYISETE